MKSITVLKLKVTSDSDAELASVAELCRRARNAGLEDWLLRQRGKTESEKQARMSPRPDKDGNPRPLSESTKVYHAVTAAVSELGTTQASMIAAEVNRNLSAKLDWRRGQSENGKRPRRRDAVLAYEDRPPWFTALEIPLHNAHVTLRFTDRLLLAIRRPLRNQKELTVEFSLRSIPPGMQKTLRELASGERKMSDSKLLYKDRKGAWYWHLPVTFETEPSSDIEATLYPTIGNPEGRGNDRPFRLHLPGGKQWFAGDGRFLRAKVSRLIIKRKQIGWRYRSRQGAGHGRKKVDRAVRSCREQQRNATSEVRRRAIVDILRQCERHKVGKLVYREPSLPLREKCWFESVGLEWDWTRFLADLTNAAFRRGIAVEKKIYKWKEAQKDGWLPKKAEAETAA